MKTLFSFLVSTLIIVQAFSQTDELRKKHYNVKKNIALEGYDPVSYFYGTPAEGKSEIKFVNKGITYLFASLGNLNKFKIHPENYEPAYGGWCAFAMGKTGEKVKIDPETFKIVDGRLYVFYNFWGNPLPHLTRLHCWPL